VSNPNASGNADTWDDDPVHCDRCSRVTSEYDGHMCQHCQSMVCNSCWIMGDDVTGLDFLVSTHPETWINKLEEEIKCLRG